MGSNLIVQRAQHLLDARIRHGGFSILPKRVKTLDHKAPDKRAPSFPAQVPIGSTVGHQTTDDFEHAREPSVPRQRAPQRPRLVLFGAQGR
jgi:hypothetical protein